MKREKIKVGVMDWVAIFATILIGIGIIIYYFTRTESKVLLIFELILVFIVTIYMLYYAEGEISSSSFLFFHNLI